MITNICDAWETARLTEPVAHEVPCRTAIVMSKSQDAVRFAYVSAGSPIELLTGEPSEILTRSGQPIAVADLVSRLLDGEVAGVVTSTGPSAATPDSVALPDVFATRRQQIRRDNVQARFLLRQIGLEEVSSHRGAPAQLYADIAALWSLDLALCTDPAMLLTLGADRQRFVDSVYTERATDRLPRALGRLQDAGVRSYPRLVII